MHNNCRYSTMHINWILSTETDSYSGFNSQLLWFLDRWQSWRRYWRKTIGRWWNCLQKIIRWHGLCWLIGNSNGLLTLAAYDKSSRARLGRRLGQCLSQGVSCHSQTRCFRRGQQSWLGAGSRRIWHRIHNCSSRKCWLHRNTDCLWAFWRTAGLISQVETQSHSPLEFCWQLNMHNIGWFMNNNNNDKNHSTITAGLSSY